MENYISWSEIGQDLKNRAVHPPPRISRSTPRASMKPAPNKYYLVSAKLQRKKRPDQEQPGFNSEKWLLKFSLQFEYSIRQIDDDNRQTDELKVVILM